MTLSLERREERAKRLARFNAASERRREAYANKLGDTSSSRTIQLVKVYHDLGADGCGTDDFDSASDYEMDGSSTLDAAAVRCSPAATAYLTHVLGHPPTPADGEWTPINGNFADSSLYRHTTNRLLHQREYGFYNEAQCAYCASGARLPRRPLPAPPGPPPAPLLLWCCPLHVRVFLGSPIVHCSQRRCSQGCCGACWSTNYYSCLPTSARFSLIPSTKKQTSDYILPICVIWAESTFNDGSGKRFEGEERWTWNCHECAAKRHPVWHPPVITLINVISCMPATSPEMVAFLDSLFFARVELSLV